MSKLPDEHPPRPASHPLSLCQPGELWRPPHDDAAARQPRPAVAPHRADHLAVRAGALDARCVRQLGRGGAFLRTGEATAGRIELPFEHYPLPASEVALEDVRPRLSVQLRRRGDPRSRPHRRAPLSRSRTSHRRLGAPVRGGRGRSRYDGHPGGDDRGHQGEFTYNPRDEMGTQDPPWSRWTAAPARAATTRCS